MTLQRITNRSGQTLYVQGKELLDGATTVIDDAETPDLRSTVSPVTVRAIEWPDETMELVIFAD
jgi:hypothetical protein